MKITSKTKPRVVNYVSPSELVALKTHARSIGLRTPSQIVGLWMRQNLAANAK